MLTAGKTLFLTNRNKQDLLDLAKISISLLSQKMISCYRTIKIDNI